VTTDLTWLDAIIAGISRCDMGSRSCSLNDYYLRHKNEIEAHPERDRIIEAFRARKEDIQNVRKK
jgi:hypothetical protein